MISMFDCICFYNFWYDKLWQFQCVVFGIFFCMFVFFEIFFDSQFFFYNIGVFDILFIVYGDVFGIYDSGCEVWDDRIVL